MDCAKINNECLHNNVLQGLGKGSIKIDLSSFAVSSHNSSAYTLNIFWVLEGNLKFRGP